MTNNLLELLFCPQCNRDKLFFFDNNWLICYNCGLCYIFYYGIPIMLINEAKILMIDSMYSYFISSIPNFY